MEKQNNSIENKEIKNYHFVQWNNEKIADLWAINESIPQIQEQFYPENFYRNLIWNTHKFIKEPILDIGCGTGTLLRILSEKNDNLFGIDLSEDNCKRLNNEFQSTKKSIVVKQGKITDIPFEDNYFKTIFCTETFEHVLPEDLPIGLKEIHRVMKEDGHLIATIPYNERISYVVCPDCHAIFPPYQHMQSFDKDKIKKLLINAKLYPVYLKRIPLLSMTNSVFKDMAVLFIRQLPFTRYLFGSQFLVVGKK